jgi:hypothetical protein
MDDDELAQRLLVDQRLLRLPLVRDGKEVSAGPAETTWKGWIVAGAAAEGDGVGPAAGKAAAGKTAAGKAAAAGMGRPPTGGGRR